MLGTRYRLIFLALLVAAVGPGGAMSGFGPQTVSGAPMQRTYIPSVYKPETPCEQIPGTGYSAISVASAPSDRPAAQHADLNLALRGYLETTSASRTLIDTTGEVDAAAPQLSGLFGDRRQPAFPHAYRVYDWNWSTNSRGALLTKFPVTLLGMGTTPGEVLYVPPSGYEIYQGTYEVLVLYATNERITLKYTRDDNVIWGYTIHIEDICVEPDLVALYDSLNAQGRGTLPGLSESQPIGRAKTDEIKVAIRDTGEFMDPRWRRDWWRGY